MTGPGETGSGTTAPGRYRPHLDGIRAIAVVAVVLFHLGYAWIPGGFVGVDVFFVLSGYLITGLLLDELADRSTIRLGRFYARRARRLLPASIAVLVVVGIVSLQVLDRVQLRSLGWDTTFAALYSANWRFAFVGGDYFAAGDVPSPLVHYWSLAVEEQFYLVWPALLLGLTSLARRMRGDRWLGLVVAAIGALTAASLAASLVLVGRPSAYYGTHTRAYQLLAGALLVAVLRWRKVSPGSGRRAAALAGVGTVGSLVTLGVLAHSLPDAIHYPGPPALAVTLASLVLVASVDLAPAALPARVIGVAPAAALGRLSYSLYIWHWPVIVLLPALAADRGWSDAWTERSTLTLVMIVIALASYLAVERPIRFRLRPAAPPLGVVAFGLGTSIVVAVAAYPIFQPSSSFEKRALDSVNDIAPSEPCPYSREAWNESGGAEPCVSIEGGPDAPVIAIVGDSHAQAWQPAIEAMARDEGATVVRATRRACTPVDVTPYVVGETNQLTVEHDCTEWRRTIFPKLIEAHDPDLVIVINRSYVRSFQVDGTRYPEGGDGHLEAWTDGWEWTLDTLSAGTGTVVVGTILPTMPWRVPACLADAGEDEGCDMPVTDDTRVAPYNDVIEGFDGSRGGDVRALDLSSIPCPDGVCQAAIDDRFVFRDDNHLTADFAEHQGPAVREALQAIGVEP